jgi:hypothetical protein
MCFLTFRTYAVKKLLMSKRVDCRLLMSKCGGNKKRKKGIYSEGEVVIENAVNLRPYRYNQSFITRVASLITWPVSFRTKIRLESKTQ